MSRLLLVVVDNQHPLSAQIGHVCRFPRQLVAANSTRMVKWNSAPSPGTPLLSIHIFPPISSQRRLLIGQAQTGAAESPGRRRIDLAEGLEQSIPTV